MQDKNMLETNATSSQAINRRAFLALSGLGLAGLLAACNSGSAHTVNPTPVASKPTPTVLPTGQAALTEADWSSLASGLQGTLI